MAHLERLHFYQRPEKSLEIARLSKASQELLSLFNSSESECHFINTLYILTYKIWQSALLNRDFDIFSPLRISEFYGKRINQMTKTNIPSDFILIPDESPIYWQLWLSKSLKIRIRFTCMWHKTQNNSGLVYKIEGYFSFLCKKAQSYSTELVWWLHGVRDIGFFHLTLWPTNLKNKTSALALAISSAFQVVRR